MTLAKRPFCRKIYFWGLGIMTVLAGLGICYVAITEYWKTREALAVPAIIFGPLFPVIIVGGEWYRLKRGAKDIRCV